MHRDTKYGSAVTMYTRKQCVSRQVRFCCVQGLHENGVRGISATALWSTGGTGKQSHKKTE